INHTLDRNDDAVAAIDKALAAIDRLRSEYPSGHEHLRKLAGFWSGYRPTRDATTLPRDPQAAFRSLDRMAETLKALGDEYPDLSAFRRDVAAIDYHLAILLASGGQTAEGIAYLRKAVPILEELASQEPDVAEHRADLARVLHQLSLNSRLIKHD